MGLRGYFNIRNIVMIPIKLRIGNRIYTLTNQQKYFSNVDEGRSISFVKADLFLYIYCIRLHIVIVNHSKYCTLTPGLYEESDIRYFKSVSKGPKINGLIIANMNIVRK